MMFQRAKASVQRAFVIALFVATSGVPVSAQNQPEIEIKPDLTWQASRAAALDKLFQSLKSARNEDEAERIANKIDARFRQSGSDTLDLMASRAREAIAKGDSAVAVEILSRIIALDPEWAEAWNLRATAFFMMGDPERSRVDAIETLAREPRHIGALTGIALIFEMQGRKKDALKAYRQVSALGPELKPIKSAIERLAKQLEQPM